MKPLYICNPKLNTECKKTSCQKECYFTSNPKFKTEYSPKIKSQLECDGIEKTIKEKNHGNNQCR